MTKKKIIENQQPRNDSKTTTILYEGTTTRAKTMRLENHANESEVCETEEFQRSIKKRNREEKEYGWTRGSEKITEA